MTKEVKHDRDATCPPGQAGRICASKKTARSFLSGANGAVVQIPKRILVTIQRRTALGRAVANATNWSTGEPPIRELAGDVRIGETRSGKLRPTFAMAL